MGSPDSDVRSITLRLLRDRLVSPGTEAHAGPDQAAGGPGRRASRWSRLSGRRSGDAGGGRRGGWPYVFASCGLRVAGLRVAWLRVAWLRVAWLRVAGRAGRRGAAAGGQGRGGQLPVAFGAAAARGGRVGV